MTLRTVVPGDLMSSESGDAFIVISINETTKLKSTGHMFEHVAINCRGGIIRFFSLGMLMRSYAATLVFFVPSRGPATYQHIYLMQKALTEEERCTA